MIQTKNLAVLKLINQSAQVQVFTSEYLLSATQEKASIVVESWMDCYKVSLDERFIVSMEEDGSDVIRFGSYLSIQ